MKKQFLYSYNYNLNLTRTTIIVGLIVGIFYSLSLYSVLYLVREFFRVFTAAFSYELWVLTDDEVNFYNLFFAFISTIAGQSVCFSFWADRPIKFFGVKNYRKTSIVNDQRVLLWYFMSWFSKLAVFYGFFFCTTAYGGYKVMSFYPQYDYLFYMIIIVLFLHSWNTIRVVFKKSSLKWMIISAIIVSTLSFGTSKINLIDYKNLNEILLEKNPYYNYTLELPETATYSKRYRDRFVTDIFIVRPKNPSNGIEPVIVIDSKEIEFSKLLEILAEKKNKFDKYDRKFLRYQLYVDKNIPTGFVNKVKVEILMSGTRKIRYTVIPKDAGHIVESYRYYSINSYYPPMYYYLEDNDMNKYYSDTGQDVIDITQMDNGDCFIAGSMVHIDSIYQAISNLVSNNYDYELKFHVNSNVSFSKYLKVVIASQKAVSEIQDYLALKMYSKKYDELWIREEKRSIYTLCPFRFMEYTDEMDEFVKFYKELNMKTTVNDK